MLPQASTFGIRISRTLVALSLATLLGSLPAGLFAPVTAHADVSALQKQQAQLKQQAQKDKQAAQQQQTVAQRAENRLADVTTQINQLQSSISATQGQIADTQSQIADKDQQSAKLESDLRSMRDQQGALIRELYIMTASQPDDLTLFSNQSYSKREESDQQLTTLHKAVTAVAAKTQEQQAAVNKARADLAQKEQNLEGLKDQQTEQQTGLADVQQQQVDLKDNATATETALEAKAASEESASNKIEDQISAELSALVTAKSKGQAVNGGQNTGQRVSRGTVVGHEGSTGNSTGPHVHFECRINNVAVNCIPYVRSGTVAYPLSSFIVTQNFGEMANSAMYRGAPHSGTDISGPYGEAVHAPADGTVILNKWYGDYGNAWAEELDNGMVVLLGHMTGS